MAGYKTLKKKRRKSPKKTKRLFCTNHNCDTQCTAVLYNDWSLQMGQMGSKMALGTLTMSGDDFPSV